MKEKEPRRVAIVGAGPAGLYSIEHLLESDESIAVDLFDQMPSPWGLVRYGVAPDHPEKKQVIDKLFRYFLHDGRVRFFGAVTIGKDISHQELADCYDAVIYAVGGTGSNELGIPGENLPGVHSSKAFVGWINGHPDQADLEMPLDCERAVVIGNGNVALDVARMLIRPAEDLERTDVADHALNALRQSKVSEVVVLGRRARIHAAFHSPELEELEHLSDIDLRVTSGEDAYNASRDIDSFELERKMAVFDRLKNQETNAGKKLVLRFLASPKSIEGQSGVLGITIEANQTQRDEQGELIVKPTGESEFLECGLIVIATGYRVMPIGELPFNPNSHTIRSEAGRIVNEDGPLPFIYVTGWARRGCRGVIGTNRKCAGQVTQALLSDLTADASGSRAANADVVPKLLRDRSVSFVSREGWDRIDLAEKLAGREQDRPRVKFTDVSIMQHYAACIRS
ncbi:MAG: FAD-dependent oxidoreductase [Gammaproteobacteria bacterium]|nr:FAD-dependent oxidoreductase [Gammaproteobacteria bacterium]